MYEQQKRFQWKLLSLLALTFGVAQTITSTSYDFIFQQLQFQPLLFSDEIYITAMTSNKDYTLIGSSSEGIKWINNKSIQIIDVQSNSLSGKTLSAIAITRDSSFLYTSCDNKLSMYSISITKNFSLQLLKQSQESFGVITKIYLIQEDKIAIILCDQGAIIAYDVQSKLPGDKLLIFSSWYAASKNIMGFIRITDNLKWIFIPDLDKGVFILSLGIKQDQLGNVSSVSMILAASAYARYTNQVEVSKDLTMMIILESWRGLRVIPLVDLFAANPSQYPIVLPNKDLWWYNSLMQPIFYGSYVSQDSKYLITAVRSQGLILFDIQNPTIPLLYYQIQIQGCPTMIEMVDGQNILFYINGKSVLIYEKVKPNMNNHFPNVFNGHQSKLFSYSNQFAQWRYYVSQEQNYIIASQWYDSLFIFCLLEIPIINNLKNGVSQVTGFNLQYFFNQYSGDVDFLELKNGDPYNISLFKRMSAVQNTRTCTMVFEDNNRYMYRPVRQDGTFLIVYDILNIKNFANTDFPIVSKFMNSNPLRGEDLVFSKDKQLLIVNYGQGIVLLDSKDKFNLKEISYWYIPLELNGWPSSIAISDDNKYVIVASRTIGTFFLVDITIQQNPHLIDKIYTTGAELIIKSSLQNIAYVCDGTAGFAIMDFSVLPEIKFISRTEVDGWCNHMTLIVDENYALISSMDYNGMISIIDIQDKKNPFVVSKFIVNNEQSIANCLLNNLEYGFSTSNKGLRIFPLKSQVDIHSSFYEKINSSMLNSINSDLFVGQVVQIQLLPIYISNGMKILDVFYYQNYQLHSLPNWIQFISMSSQILINVDKNGIKSKNSSSNSKPSQNILLVKTGVPIKSSSFIFDEIPTDTNQSLAIYQFLKEKGTIDSDDMVTLQFDQNNPINLQTISVPQSKRLVDLVQLTLQRGFYYNPVIFTVQKSLLFNPQDISKMISTYSSEIRVEISVLTAYKGEFVTKAYEGVIVSISESGQSILIQGTLFAVNAVLKSKIFYFLDKSSSITSKILVEIIINDGLNDNLLTQMDIEECVLYFIHLKQPILQSIPLQKQVDEQYQNSELTVLEQISINFVSTTFQDQDKFPLTYKVFISSSNIGSYVALNSDYWLKFQPSSTSFTGTAPISMFRSQIFLKIEVTDGFSILNDTFTIKLYKLPFFYVLNLLFSILTPILSILGIYRYRYILINQINFKNTVYSKEYIKTNTTYVKYIPLLDQNVSLAQSIVKQYIKEIEKKGGKCKSQNDIEIGTIKSSQKIHNSDPKNNYIYNTNTDMNNQTNLNNQTYINNNTSIYMQKKQRKSSDIGILQTQEEQPMNLNRKQSFKGGIQDCNNIMQLCDRDGRINMNKLINQMENINLQYKFSGKLRHFHHVKHQLFKNDTLLFFSIKILMSRYILSKNNNLMSFYQLLKEKSLNSKLYTKNDWYHAYISVDLENIDNMKQSLQTVNNIFTIFNPKEESIRSVIELMSKEKKDTNSQFSISQQNLNLIKDILIGDALGIVEFTPSRFQKCIGESLWLGMQDILSVQAHIKMNQGFFLQLKRFFNCNYSHYGIQHNMKLPNWLSFSYQRGLIILKGTPNVEDVEEFQIRISDINNYVLKTFDVEVYTPQFNQETIITQFNTHNIPTEQNRLFNKLTRRHLEKNISIQSLLLQASCKISESSTYNDKTSKNNNITPIENLKGKEYLTNMQEEKDEIDEINIFDDSPNLNTQYVLNSKKQNLQLKDGAASYDWPILNMDSIINKQI